MRNDSLASLKKKKEGWKSQNKTEKSASNTRPATGGTKKRIFPAVKEAWSEHLPQENGNNKDSNVRVRTNPTVKNSCHLFEK